MLVYHHRHKQAMTSGFSVALSSNSTTRLGSRMPRIVESVRRASSSQQWVQRAVDVCNSSIPIALHTTLTTARSFGKGGSGKGQFDSPYDIACDSTGKVYVADTINRRVQVFTPEGSFLRMFATGMVGQRCSPYYMTIDSSDTIYVILAPYGEVVDHIYLFTSEGQFVTSFGSGFEDPRGLAVDNSGVLYVCDSNCVHLF